MDLLVSALEILMRWDVALALLSRPGSETLGHCGAA